MNFKSNMYQIAWSLSCNRLALARSDMKAWMVSISFVVPASMPRESWNTNPRLLLKTNSSVMLWTPRWEVISSDQWKYQDTHSWWWVNLQELTQVTLGGMQQWKIHTPCHLRIAQCISKLLSSQHLVDQWSVHETAKFSFVFPQDPLQISAKDDDI